MKLVDGAKIAATPQRLWAVFVAVRKY